MSKDKEKTKPQAQEQTKSKKVDFKEELEKEVIKIFEGLF